MASAPQPQSVLPLLYQELVPLSSVDHVSWKIRPLPDFSLIANVHAVPLTVEEFPLAQRYYPIVFAGGDEGVPLALMGLNEGVNVFVDGQGQFTGGYLPAYVRRYPWMLARLTQDAEEMSLCFDPTLNVLGEFDDGIPLFENGQPAQFIQNTLQFCEQFEIAVAQTQQFMRELRELNIAEDAQFTIQHPSMQQPYNYTGFVMVNEDKLRDLRGDQLRKLMQNGMLPLIHAHMFSLGMMNDLFQKQWDQGRVPPQLPGAANA
jgi:hypothetical protein